MATFFSRYRRRKLAIRINRQLLETGFYYLVSAAFLLTLALAILFIIVEAWMLEDEIFRRTF